MTSHEYAKELQKTVDHLLSRQEVEFESYAQPFLFVSFYDKEKFVSAVRAMGSGEKKFETVDLRFEPNDTCLIMSIGKDKVCRKVQEAKWECDPLFSDEEIAQLT